MDATCEVARTSGELMHLLDQHNLADLLAAKHLLDRFDGDVSSAIECLSIADKVQALLYPDYSEDGQEEFLQRHRIMRRTVSREEHGKDAAGTVAG